MGTVLLAAAALSAIAIPIVVGYAALQGRPKNFSREMYWTFFILTGAAALALGIVAQLTSISDSWHTFMHYSCGILSFLLFGLAAGCLVGIFAYRGRIFSKLSEPK